ncbi:hypothetical protein [Solibacillus sp. R5-41]|uniref:hypothetical protein n=1 Tax=Solibacillus sp. R5-41 TaxID=2048654 RepID=UPI0012FD54CA|nr:hypothetical protein [Solibacillus sp. R5-41]
MSNCLYENTEQLRIICVNNIGCILGSGGQNLIVSKLKVRDRTTVQPLHRQICATITVDKTAIM